MRQGTPSLRLSPARGERGAGAPFVEAAWHRRSRWASAKRKFFVVRPFQWWCGLAAGRQPRHARARAVPARHCLIAKVKDRQPKSAAAALAATWRGVFAAGNRGGDDGVRSTKAMAHCDITTPARRRPVVANALGPSARFVAHFFPRRTSRATSLAGNVRAPIFARICLSTIALASGHPRQHAQGRRGGAWGNTSARRGASRRFIENLDAFHAETAGFRAPAFRLPFLQDGNAEIMGRVPSRRVFSRPAPASHNSLRCQVARSIRARSDDWAKVNLLQTWQRAAQAH